MGDDRSTLKSLKTFDLATASYGSFKAAMGQAVRITRTPPRWKLPYVLAGSVMHLAPTWHEWHLRDDHVAFVVSYRDRMDRLGVDQIADLIQAVCPVGTAVLCCYEKLTGIPPDEQQFVCHRRVFAAWWSENSGDEVPELEAMP